MLDSYILIFKMRRINLKCLYPDRYSEDILIDVSDAVYKELRKKAKVHHESLIDMTVGDVLLSPKQLLFINERNLSLYKCLLELPLQQQNRIYEVYILGYSKSAVARLEGCTEGAVRKSIKRGLLQLKQKLKLYYR